MSAPGLTGADAAEVVWHDLECGGYRADLDLWRRLADEQIDPRGSAPILDVGAGSGRVSIELARRGHRVVALDRSAALLAALAARSGGLAIETVCADARELSLEETGFALCVVAMQTLQLLGGPHGRREFLARARAHMRPGGLLCAALVTAPETFDVASGDHPPTAESARVGRRLYISSPSRVALGARTIVIERERRIIGPNADAPRPAERDTIELDRVSPASLRREARAVGLRAAGKFEIAATADHVGSTVVALRA
ncbi:MAG TPA: methyltransferase domain-containing protein [Solirubrobacteraceae bacterium]|jgi:SAM-dependent methyltransferase|nr:methyltransferase domain-containing protein [Solirubrobacteraceae bacterium]